MTLTATQSRDRATTRNLLETLESVGSVVTTLSTIGTTTVRIGR